MGRKNREKRSRVASPASGAARERGEAASPSIVAESGAGVSAPRSAPAAPAARASAASRRLRVPADRLPAQAWAIVAGLVVAAFAVYSTAIDNPFLLDDPTNIAKNETIQKPLSWSALAMDPRAAVTLTLRWNWLLGGENPAGYHLLNMLAHGMTGALVFLFARATLLLPFFGDRYRRGIDAVAAAVALVFLLHPIQTESVTYVIQRAEIFVSAALVGALLAFARLAAAQQQAPSERLLAIPSRAFLPLAGLAVACVGGIYSKPSFAVVPALLVAYELCFLSRGDWRGLVQRWPAWLVTTAAAVLTFGVTKSGGAFEGNTSGFRMEGIAPLDYLASQPGVLVHYLRKTLWPTDLCFDCGYRGAWPVHATFLGDSVLLPLAILAVLAAVSLVFWRRQPLLAFALFGSAIVLSPTSSVVPLADFYVEHRMYLPIALLALAAVPMAWDGLRATIRDRRTAEIAGLVAVGGIAMLYSAGTVLRNAELAHPIALMQASLEQAPKNERVHYNLANALRREGRLEEAIPHYEEAIRLLPKVIRSYQNLGGLYMEQRKTEKALEVYEAGAAAKPETAMAHRNVANAALQLGRYERALEAAETAIRTERNNPNGWRLKGDALLRLGRREEAIAAWREGQKYAPRDQNLRDRLAKAAR